MNIKTAVTVFFAFSLIFSISCNQAGSLSLSDSLTTFITPEKILKEENDRRIIQNSTGNLLRDAIRVINSDQRTSGYFKNLSLLNTSISKENTSYTFSGIVSGSINDILTNTSQQVVVTLQKDPEALYYELNFGAAP